MVELRASLMQCPGLDEIMPATLAEFEAQYHVHVQLDVLSWKAGWDKLTSTALSGEGYDVSSVGTTWIQSLATMNLLRPFSEGETAASGGTRTFAPAVWQAGVDSAIHGIVWAIPFFGSVRLVYYRRDLLRQAGIDEREAFTSGEQLLNTLERLQASGIVEPLAMDVFTSSLSMQQLAPWLWSAGGDFISQDGRHAGFADPKTLEGVRTYFSLHRFMPHWLSDSTSVDDLFRAGKIAVIPAGEWLHAGITREGTTWGLENLGIANPWAAPLAGGESIVVWQNSRHVHEAAVFARFLTNARTQRHWFEHIDHLPARLELLDAPPFSTDPLLQVLAGGLKQGRMFRTPYMWGVVEERLTKVLVEIWRDLFANPQLDIGQVTAERLSNLAQQLDGILGGA